MRAIIMAGGKGRRLLPYTAVIPKPLVPIGGERAILDVVIHQLKRSGVDHITIAVNHFANFIMAYAGNGSKYGITIDYSVEEKPLHTIGPLTLIRDLPENFLVINGDTLSTVDYGKFYDEHVRRKNMISIVIKKREVKADFGIVEFDASGRLTAFKEKPTHYSHVSTGINCFHRSVIEKLEKGKWYGFDDLMRDNLARGEKVWVHNFDGLWFDIGRPEDYHHVNENYENLKKEFFL